MQDYSELEESILARAAQVNQAAIDEATTLCNQLPPPGMGFDAPAARCLSQTAFAAEQLRQYAAAEPLYSKALEYTGTTALDAVNSHFRLGICLEAQGKLESATRHFRIAASREADWPLVGQLARFHAAYLLMLSGDYSEAASEFNVLCAQDLRPEIPELDLRLQRLICVLRTGDFGEPDLADPMIDSLHTLPPGMAPASVQFVIDLALAAEQRSSYELAERLYRAVIASPDVPPTFHANAWFRLGLVQDLCGHWNGTEECYRRALRHPHAWPELKDLARFHLANLLMTGESFEEAAYLFAEHAGQAVTSLLPSSELRLREAICRFRADDDRTAERILLSIRETHGDTMPAVEQWMAEIYESRRDYASASACYQKLIQNPASDVSVKAAALQRLNSIRA